MMPTNPCCEKCFGYIEGWDRPQLGCKDNDCQCHTAATATPESKKHENWTGQAPIQPETAKSGHVPPESVPAQEEWEKAFNIRFTADCSRLEHPDIPCRHWSQEDNVGGVKAFIRKQLAQAREEGKAYWEPSEHHKNVWREEGRRQMKEEILGVAESMKMEIPRGYYAQPVRAPSHAHTYNNALNAFIEAITSKQ